jgi:hypothetical protein
VYDLFFIGNSDTHWRRLKSRFPQARQIRVSSNIRNAVLEAGRQSFTPMFWAVWDDVNVRDDFNFEFKAPEWDYSYVHVLKNGRHNDGICLFPKATQVSNRELEYRFFFNKKEIDIRASQPDPYDIVFISYNESFAETNFNRLQVQYPLKQIHRVHGVKGIHQAHIQAASLVKSKMFWVVDADAVLVDTFNFDYQVVKHNQDAVHVWRSQNPVNNLIYGYGGVKLLPTELTRQVDVNKPDMTTSIASKFVAVDEISNITAFNVDPFSTWRSAFRECVKLSSKVIDNQVDTETEHRLNVWCALNEDVAYGYYAYLGALAGKQYGLENKNNIEALQKINDYNWLNEQFLKLKEEQYVNT